MAFHSVYFRAAALLVSFVVSTALIAGFFGRVHPALDSIGHFRGHLSVALAMCALALLAAGFRLNALTAGLLAAAALITVLPSSPLRLPTAQAAASETGAPVYRLLQLNLRWNHPEPERILKLIEKEDPDIITLDEFSPMWKKQMVALWAAYPNRVICSTANNGSVILSRLPFLESGKALCLDRGALAIAKLDLDGRTAAVGAIHLSWPWPRAQSRQIDRLAEQISSFEDTAILAGDFNATTWSAAVRRVSELGKFTIVDGIGATWIDYKFPRNLRWAGFPIDHIMVKGDIQVRSARILEDVGSDHWPVLLEFSLRQAEAV